MDLQMGQVLSSALTCGLGRTKTKEIMIRLWLLCPLLPAVRSGSCHISHDLAAGRQCLADLGQTMLISVIFICMAEK